MKSADFMKRTHTCGELTINNRGEKVVLNGWIQRRRDLGGLIFIDLRDRTGLTQICFNPEDNPELFEVAESLRSEFVIAVEGTVNERPEGSSNPNLKTGEIELNVEKLQLLNKSKTPPFVIKDELTIDETLRMKYRYLDLRRPKMYNNFEIRHKFTKAVRDFLDNEKFLEIETPMLVRSTPEGARDYLVPVRVQPGKFYALPQSPQLFKQLLMVSGMDRYFQIARCFRDEDLRADRQPEFTQIDIEMSFVKQDDVLSLVENMMAYCFKTVLNREIQVPFPRMTWHEAFDRYGSDKPDTRFGMEIVDVTEIVKETTFKVFTDVIGSGGVIRGILLPGCASFSRKQIDELSAFVKTFGAHGVLPIALKPDSFKSPLSKHLSDDQKNDLISAFNAVEGDFIAILAGTPEFVNPILGRLRLKMGSDLNLIDKKRDDFLWVVDFPMFAWNEEENRLDAEHHAFTSPKIEDIDKMDKEPLKVRANAYDMVYNGNETASGSIRIHDKGLQQKILEAIGMSLEEAHAKFGFLLDAFEYGAPPHGGVALGLDRIIAEICGEESIREVIIFPKNTSGICPLTHAPVAVDDDQLEILKLKSTANKGKEE